jgi:uncharacterized protein YndB with AHSA1/START domain
MFRLAERELDELPIRISRQVELAAPPEAVFGVLADHAGWPTWFRGMKRVRIDGPAAGIGALRTVWVPPAKVQERFSRWDEGRGLTFHIVASSVPGLRAMTEDWQLEPLGTAGTRLVIDVGVEPAPWARPARLVERVVRNATKGASGIAVCFSPSRPVS